MTDLLILLALAALIGVPIWICMVGYMDEMTKIAREGELSDKLVFLKIQDQIRRSDLRNGRAPFHTAPSCRNPRTCPQQCWRHLRESELARADTRAGAP